MKIQVKYGVFAIVVFCCLGAGYQTTGQSEDQELQLDELQISSVSENNQTHKTRDWNNVPLR